MGSAMLWAVISAAGVAAAGARAVREPPIAPRRSSPAQDSASAFPAAQRALRVPGYVWRRDSVAGVEVYVLAGSAAEPLLAGLAARADRAVAANLAWLGAAPGETRGTSGARASSDARDRPRVRLFFVGSREAMRPLTGGRTPGGWAEVTEGTAFFVANGRVRPALRHETMHLLARQRWGPPPADWASEGLATLAVGGCAGYALDDVAAALARAGRLVPLDTLRRAWTAAGERGAALYLGAASVVGYIDRTYGRPRLRAVWQGGGLATVERTLGVSAATLEARWRAAVTRRPAQRSWTEIVRDVERRGCE